LPYSQNRNSENDAENSLVIRDKKLAKRYIKNWEEHDGHSEGYMARGK
jgi:phosphatidylserine/phosphatidylglycerophosphate/cardiolipin synthase-like enzyme